MRTVLLSHNKEKIYDILQSILICDIIENCKKLKIRQIEEV